MAGTFEFKKFVYIEGAYSKKFSCKKNGYKIHFYRGREYLVKDEESIKELENNPFFLLVEPVKIVKPKPRTVKNKPKLSEVMKGNK